MQRSWVKCRVVFCFAFRVPTHARTRLAGDPRARPLPPLAVAHSAFMSARYDFIQFTVSN
jgi:hypothetical protein